MIRCQQLDVRKITVSTKKEINKWQLFCHDVIHNQVYNFEGPPFVSSNFSKIRSYVEFVAYTNYNWIIPIDKNTISCSKHMGFI